MIKTILASLSLVSVHITAQRTRVPFFQSITALIMDTEDLTERISHLKNIVVSSFTPYLLAAIITLVVFREISKKKHKIPPGPMGLPIVGYKPFIGDMPHETFHKLCKKYGNVISFYLGTRRFVVAGDYAAIKEMLGKDEFLDRPERSISGLAIPDPSVITVNGPVWKEQRRFALQQLRDLGFGKSRLEEHIQEEIACFVKELVRHSGNVPNLKQLLSVSVANNIRLLVFGHRKEYDDPKSIETERCMSRINMHIGTAQFQYYLPSWVSKAKSLLHLDDSIERVRKEALRLRNVIIGELEEHKKSFQEDDIRDYVDGFLMEMKNREQNGYTSFNDAFLHGNAILFFGAGTDTVRTTLSWIILLMAVHQDIQEMAYKEIMEVIGKERMPSWSDHKDLPYCEAIIAEVHRYKTIVPVNVERSPSRDTTLQGYHIPKDTTIMSNIWAVHNDPLYWKNPEKFDPSRFLTEDGKKYVRNERLMPFSAGRRSCPGETMANVETFLYFTSILQRFQIVPKDGQTVDLEGTFEATLQPKSVDSVSFKQRSSNTF